MTTGFIEDCIRRAKQHDSGLDASVLEVPGFSTGVMRRLWNNLCVEVHSYLEVGAYFGGTACAAMNNNSGLSAVFYENGSQEFHGRPILDALRTNLARTYIPIGTNYQVIEEDFFLSPVETRAPFDFYFYDGHHDREWQSQALPHAFPALARQFLFAVDDYNWDSVADGTADGFETLGDEVSIVNAWELRGEKKQDDKIWHNGVALFLCEKL